MEIKRQLEVLIDEKYDKLYACAYRMLGNHHDAEDGLQNALLKAYKGLDHFRGDSELYTWVYRIVMNECNRSYRVIKKLPVVRISENLGMSESEFFSTLKFTPNFEDQLIMDEMREKCLHAFLKCLPKNQRICFILKSCLHLNYDEISQVMNISIENVKVTLYRGRKRLQELFEMRCSLIDPEKPCECHLWIKYMKDHHLPLPSGYHQPKTETLKTEHYNNMSLIHKMDYLYTVEAVISKDEFIENLKKITENM